jgi:polyferredoxin
MDRGVIVETWDKLRRWVILGVGSVLLALALTTDHGNMQLEGLFFALLVGTGAWIVLHFAIAKILGPLVFGRVWCGWACWFGMVFDLLPYPHSRYRIPGWIDKLRYVHFAASLGAAALFWLAFGVQGAVGTHGLLWFGVGLAAYYALGIGMALTLKDNRAFCKYLCPLGVLTKFTSRFALVKVSGDAAKCATCKACVSTELCPMNIRVNDYILNGERVLSTECTLCQTCIRVCPQDALGLSVRLDVGGKEYIDYEPPRFRRDPFRLNPFAKRDKSS